MYLVLLAFSLDFCVGLVPRGVFWGVLHLPLQQEHFHYHYHYHCHYHSCDTGEDNDNYFNRGNSDYVSSVRGERSPRVA